MSGWQLQGKNTHTIVWGIQETHINTEEAAKTAEALWDSDRDPQLTERSSVSSYWSVSSGKTGGVAILLDPRRQHECHQWHPELWSQRVIAVVVKSILVVNVYAPNDRTERERLFRQCSNGPGHNRTWCF